MPRSIRRRLLMSVIAVITLGGLSAFAITDPFGLFGRFEVDGMRINPRAAVRDDVTYELTVWEEAFFVPWAARSQAEMLEAAIEQFSRQRPNVNITYTLLDADTGRTQLTAAVAAGRPPDVYGTTRGALVGSPRLVPASPYMPPVERSEPPPFVPAATSPLTVADTLWGWPRALWWDAWLGSKESLARAGIDHTRLVADGWDRDAFLQWIHHSTGAHRLMLDFTDVAILEQLMAAAGVPAYVDASGDVAWQRQQIIDAAAFIRAVRHSDAVGRELELMSRTRLRALYEDDATIIGPVNPYTALSAFHRTADQFVLVPVPHPSSTGRHMSTEPSAYFVFHQAVYQGDDHTRLAAELAAFLAAKSEQWLVEAIGLLPARTAGWETWRERAPFGEASRTLLEQAAAHAMPVPAAQDEQLTASVREALLPMWRSFLSDQMTPEQFGDAAMRAIERTVNYETPSREAP